MRYLMLAGLVFFMGMLYWSSLSLEEEVRSIKNDLANLSRAANSSLQRSSSSYMLPEKTILTNPRKSLIDPSFPNLLTEDPFYKTTLPKLLKNDFRPLGVRKEATIGKPQNIHPFSNWAEINTWLNLCSVSVATTQTGKYETYAPDMGIKMEERKNPITGKPEYWIHLRDDVYWQPLEQKHFGTNVTLAPHFLQKHQVTAHDFKFYYDAVMNPHVQNEKAAALRNYFFDIEAFEVIDDLTFVVRWATKEFPDGPKMKYSAKGWTGSLRPLASFVYQYFPDGSKIISDDSDPNTYRTNSVWAQNFSMHWASQIIVSCGAWAFDGMTDRFIRFKRNSDYYDPLASLTEGIEYAFKDNYDVIWQSFKALELDKITLPPHQMLELETFLESIPYQNQSKQGMGIHRLNYFERRYTYIGWNEVKPFFKSKKVRQALTMAIDRKRIIQQIRNGMAVEITGDFFIFSPSYNKSLKPWPFDLHRAKALLAEEGWYDSDGDGIIDKVIDGKLTPFQFSLTYFVKDQIAKAICEYVATTLKEIGISCNLRGVDLADLSTVFEDKSFDAVLMAWGLGSPPEDPRQIWSSAGAKEKGSSNAIGFANAEIDKIIDQLDYEYDPKKRIELYYRFNDIIHDEQPYTFLYTPKTSMIYRDYLENVFIPADRQDLIPGANVEEPIPGLFWLRKGQ